MTAVDCIGEIKAAAGRDVTDAEVLAAAEAVQLRADALRRDRVDLSEADLRRAAAGQLGAEARMAAAIEARNAKQNLLKRVARREFYASAPAVGGTPGPLVGMEAKLVGVNTVFAGARKSVDAQGNALRRLWLGGMTVDIDRAGLFAAVRKGHYDRAIAAELFELSRDAGGRPGISGNTAARQAAEIIHKYQRAAVDAQNRAGAWIGTADGYIARTSHDSDRIRRAGYQTWRDDFLRTPGIERTFDGVRDRETFLRHVYHSLVTGIHVTTEGSRGFKDPAFTGPGNLGKRLSQERVLQFDDAGGWMDYQAKYGAKTLVENVISALDQAARNTALMREFGTNPRAEFDADLTWLEQTWVDRDLDVASKIKGAREKLANRFSELDGTARMPVNRQAARIAAGIRTWLSMAKLGGVTLSAVTDVPLKAAELKYQGIGLLESYGDGLAALLRGRGDGETREAIDLLGAGLDGMVGDIASRFDAADTTPGTLSKLANAFFRWNGLTYWTDAQRAGAELLMSRHLGRQLDTAYAALAPETRRMLTLFDIRAEEWDALRTVTDWATVDGRAHVTPDRARHIADDALEPIVGARLAEIRQGLLDQAVKGGEALDRLEARLTRLEADLAREVPTARDLDRLDIKATFTAWRRQADAISALRDRIVAGRDGAATTNQVLATMRREVEALAKAEHKLGANAVRDAERLLARMERGTARRAEAEAALEAVKDRMASRMEDMAGLPDRLDAETAKVRDEAREALALKLAAYFTDRGEYAIINTDANVRAIMRQGTQPGTFKGELLRSLFQFKAFPVAVVTKAWGRELHGREGGVGRNAGIVHMMVATTVFGYLAMTLKDLFKDRTPRDPTDPKTWAAAFVQGGGAGIYGDYIVGDYSRFGRSMLASAAGPSLGQLDDLAELLNRAKSGDDLAAQGVRFIVNNTPFVNLFYTRAGLDFLVLYQVQEALNPGFLRRFEKRVEKENHQTFLLRPSDVIARGGGFK